jgi:hypothetical protein
LPGVFAGGDLVTGPNTVVDAIAAGKKAARSIQQYIEGQEIVSNSKVRLPEVFVEPPPPAPEPRGATARVEPHTLPPKARIRNFKEVEMVLYEEQARAEAKRCLRCDLEFTRQRQKDGRGVEQGGARG